MRANRMFFSQEVVDRWLEAGQVNLEGDRLSLIEGPTFRLTSGVVFKAEVSSGVDPLDLCGRVKTISEVEALLGDLVPGSVLIGDQAYEVVDGFLGELVSAADGGDSLGALQRLVAEG
jgi:hypothetical protein